MRVLRITVLSVMLVAMMSVATAAHAYDETSSGRTCVQCHGNGADTSEPSGPHGGYLATTSKCATCHTVHAAPADGILLLPEATIKATCEVCHDGTAGGGVYGVVLKRTGAAAASQHRVIDTNPGTITTIPGGAKGGGDATFTFSGAGGNLTCSDCHSPHGTSVVSGFTGDRARSTTDGSIGPVITSTRLLKQRPTSILAATANVTQYGSDWCGACHVGRLSGSGMPNNHPVESTVNPAVDLSVFVYETVARLGGGTGLGQSNLGYKMADPSPGGHRPICQQCHEDARDVGEPLDTVDTFDISTVDGTPNGPEATYTGSNPRFQTFPHESQMLGLLVSDWRDSNFCLSCHSNPDMLP